MGNKQFDEQDSLKLINEMINTAKGNLQKGAGKYIVFIASAVHFIMLNTSTQKGLEASGYIWAIAGISGIVVTAFFIANDWKKTLVKTYTDSIISSIWIGFGCGAFLLAFLLSGKSGAYIYPSILFMYTLALFISATAYRFRWMYISVIICLVCAVSYKFIPFVYFPVPMAIAMLCGNIIPGHILNCKAKQQHV